MTLRTNASGKLVEHRDVLEVNGVRYVLNRVEYVS